MEYLYPALGAKSRPPSQDFSDLMKQLAPGAVEYIGGCCVGSDILSQHISCLVYLSSKGLGDCAVSEKEDRLNSAGLNHMMSAQS